MTTLKINTMVDMDLHRDTYEWDDYTDPFYTFEDNHGFRDFIEITPTSPYILLIYSSGDYAELLDCIKIKYKKDINKKILEYMLKKTKINFKFNTLQTFDYRIDTLVIPLDKELNKFNKRHIKRQILREKLPWGLEEDYARSGYW